jgi:aspartyl-tRNA(Asn)/glutamyl-tRNA(Gln) amidotransferase subunit A
VTLGHATASELARLVARREVSARALVHAFLDRIATIDPRLGCYLHVCADAALARADELDEKLARGELVGPLAGVPIALKDIFVTRGVPTTCASRILAGWVPPYEGTPSARLADAGAILLGKLNMDEFAMGSSNENSSVGPVKNPWNPAFVPGGSSGGSAAAVAAGLCAAALGTDTGGSIRQPASLSGVVGLKPTYGRVSRYGVVAFASSLDQVGPLCRSAEDAALLLEVLAGPDPRDATSIDAPVPRYRDALAQGVRGLRLGVPREYFAAGLETDVERAVRAAIAALSRAGAHLVDVTLPHSEYAVATYYIIATAEASSNLARYDGVRFGHRADGATDLLEMYCRTRGEGFGPEVKRRIMLGTYVLRAGYYEAYYGKAQQVRTLIGRDFARAFEACDVIVAPTSPMAGFRLGEKTADPLAMYLADILTISCNLAGLPGMSIPCGFSGGGLPIGLQLIGPALGEPALFRVAGAYQGSTDWHTRRPPLAA